MAAGLLRQITKPGLQSRWLGGALRSAPFLAPVLCSLTMRRRAWLQDSLCKSDKPPNPSRYLLLDKQADVRVCREIQKSCGTADFQAVENIVSVDLHDAHGCRAGDEPGAAVTAHRD